MSSSASSTPASSSAGRCRRCATRPIPRRRGGTTPLFVLRTLAIAGNETIGSDELKDAANAWVGRKVSERDLWELTRRLSALYQDRGYFLSRVYIPPQDARSGRLNLRVVEGGLVDIQIVDDPADQFGLRARLLPLLAEQPLRLATFERLLLLASDTPGVRITDSAIEDIDANAGKYRLVIRAKAWRTFTTVGVDNRLPSGIGPLKTFLSANANSLLSAGDTLGINLETTQHGPRELGFANFAFEMPFGSNSARLGLYGTFSEFSPYDARRLVDTRKTTRSLEERITFTAVRTRELSIRLFGGLSGTVADETTAYGSVYQDAILAATFGAEFQGSDRLGGSNYATLYVRHGFDVLGASQRWDPGNSRLDAGGEFTKAAFFASRIQPLGGPWSTRVAATGQLSGDPLLTSEQFFLGGPLFGRGYSSGVLGADQGIAGVAELRYDLPTAGTRYDSLQLYTFVDGAALDDRRLAARRYLPLYSAGGGLRFRVGEALMGQVELAFPFGGYARTDADRNARIFFSLSRAFASCATPACRS